MRIGVIRRRNNNGGFGPHFLVSRCLFFPRVHLKEKEEPAAAEEEDGG